MRSLTLVLLALMTGCAGNYLRVTEYSADGSAVALFTGAADGCAVNLEGDFSKWTITYDGTNCDVSHVPE